MMTILDQRDIAEAWNSVTDRWIVRRDKSYAVRQWAVVHDWGDDVVSAATQRIVGRYKWADTALDRAKWLEEHARGCAVLAVIEMMRRPI